MSSMNYELIILVSNSLDFFLSPSIFFYNIPKCDVCDCTTLFITWFLAVSYIINWVILGIIF